MYELALPFRRPFDWTSLLHFLEARAVPGVEAVESGRYVRNVRLGSLVGTLEVSMSARGDALVAAVGLPRRTRTEVEARLRAMFDLDCDPELVGRALGRSPLLGPHARRHPGIRVPGAWEPFEILVRAIVGQQVSVAGARTILGRLAQRAHDGGPLVFPAASRLSGIDLRGLGMPHRRAEHLRRAAEAVTNGEVGLGGDAECRRQLLALPGIGPWTVAYVAMRAFRDPDAFPDGDLVLRRAAGGGEDLAATELRALAEEWRPWRAYAAILLWRGQAG